MVETEVEIKKVDGFTVINRRPILTPEERAKKDREITKILYRIWKNSKGQ